MKKYLPIIVIILFLVLLKPLFAFTKTALFISQEFPQIPVKPLHFLTPQPKHEELFFGKQRVKTDLFLPKTDKKRPALIVAMGVRIHEKDRPLLLGFCDTMARLGYIVLLSRLEDLENEVVLNERPETFVESFEYLAKRKGVDSGRISFVGISVGSSLALVAAEDKRINENVHAFVFFGGYYSIIDYFHSLATRRIAMNGLVTPWDASDSAQNHAKNILEKEGAALEQFKEPEKLDPNLREALLRFSPDKNISSFRAPIFILHEKSDTSVPYVESIKLKNALKGNLPVIFKQINLFEHVQPKKAISPGMLNEFLGLFGFLYRVFSSL